MKQREIWFTNLDPTQGSEQAGLRPVVIISGNKMNQAGLFLACPLSTKIKRFPGTIVISKNTQNGLSQDSEVLIFQIRVLSQSRLVRRMGEISQQELNNMVLELNDIFEL